MNLSKENGKDRAIVSWLTWIEISRQHQVDTAVSDSGVHTAAPFQLGSFSPTLGGLTITGMMVRTNSK